MKDLGRINDLLRHAWPSVEKRVGRGTMHWDLAPDGEHVKVRVDGKQGDIELDEDHIDDFFKAPTAKESDACRRVIENDLVRGIENLLKT